MEATLSDYVEPGAHGFDAIAEGISEDPQHHRLARSKGPYISELAFAVKG